MKKITLSLVAVSALSITSSFAADSIEGMFKEGKASGQIRSFYINREMSGSAPSYSRDGLALGGKIGYETGSFNGISAGAFFYTSNKLDNENPVAARNDKTLFNSTDDGYSYLGQAYIQGKFGGTTVKVGRQQLDTPLAGADDARMLPTLFEAAVAINSDIKDTTLICAHVSRIAYGSFASGFVNTGAVYQLTGVYGIQTANYKNGEFQPMSQGALGSNVKGEGVTAVAAIYKGIPGLTLQVWDYYAYDILNAIYAQADYTMKLDATTSVTASGQYINESEIGEKLAGNVNSNYYGVQLAAKHNNFNAAVAYSHTGKDTTATIKGGIISPWGGAPEFTGAMVTRHSFFADTGAYKITTGYNFKEMTGYDITGSIYTSAFIMGKDNAYTTTSYTAREHGFDIIENVESIKGLQLRLRGNFQRTFTSATASQNRNEYRAIVNYNF